jgi:hypothetical protein
MYLRWTNFKCPHCATSWASRVVSAPRVGIEVRTCNNCGREFFSHDREWAHMTRGQKRGYLVSEWVIAWLLFYGLLFIMVPGSDDKMGTVLILLGLGAVMFSPLVVARAVAIRKSNGRIGASPL